MTEINDFTTLEYDSCGYVEEWPGLQLTLKMLIRRRKIRRACDCIVRTLITKNAYYLFFILGRK